MDETIVCPNCGEANPADMAFCSSCQWRLRPLNDESPTDRTMADAPELPPASAELAADDSVPDWLRNLTSAPRSERSAEEALADQLRARLDSQDAEDPLANKPRPEAPEDLLAGLMKSEEPQDEAIPDWVARIMGIPENDDSGRSGEGETAGQAVPADGAYLDGTLFDRDTDDLARPDRAQEPRSGRPNSDSSDQRYAAVDDDASTRSPESEDIYQWLRKLDADHSAPPIAATPRKDVPATTDVPTWVGRMLSVTGEATPESGQDGEMPPPWISGTSIQPEEPPPPVGPSLIEETPFAPQPPELPLTELPVVAASEPQPETPAESTRLEASEAGPTDALDVDAVFASMQLPAWAAEGDSQQVPGALVKPPASRAEELAEPAELPSWVQAMRPVESAAAAVGSQTPDVPRESRGPLSGLEGVLPAIPGAAIPSNRPSPQALTPGVSDRHRAHALLLEDLLSAESRPLPLQDERRHSMTRPLRWAIGAALLVAPMIGLLSGSNSFALPAAVPIESTAALQVVENLPAGTPVLAVFDYEPATAGEMDVAAGSIMDHLLLLKHPRLVLLSTSPTGSALAERFLSSTLSERGYLRDQHYVDLGYLPGDLSGVQLFGRDPIAAMPYGASTDQVWLSPVLLGISRLADFSAIIVLTDSQENGSVWIEQTTGLRGEVPMLIIASAQAGPMLLPYFDSGQVQGLVVGINGAASTETANGGRPGLVRQYWDAYNLGLYTAAVLIPLGAAWQLISGLRRRRTGTA